MKIKLSALSKTLEKIKKQITVQEKIYPIPISDKGLALRIYK
jgi:hypothetical protein